MSMATGFDDLIAGANLSGDGGSAAGEAYVVYGGTHLGEVVSHAQTLVGGMVPTLPDSPTPAQIEAAARAAFLHGGAGDDTLTAHADTTVLYGGAGRRRPRAGGRHVPPRRRRLGL